MIANKKITSAGNSVTIQGIPIDINNCTLTETSDPIAESNKVSPLYVEEIVSADLVEEVIGCIFDYGLSEQDAIEYAYNTINNIDTGEIK